MVRGLDLGLCGGGGDAMSGLGDLREGGRCVEGLGGFANAYERGIKDVVHVSANWRSKRARGIKRRLNEGALF